ncbi:MAG: M4 family metallopeptidase [Bacteroidia bacterium]
MQKAIASYISIVFFSLSIFVSNLNAQVFEGSAANARLRGASTLRINENTGTIQFARLESEVRIQSEQINAYLKKVYQLDDSYSFREINKTHDEIGYTHLRLQLMYNSVDILGAVLITHSKDGRLVSFNGEVFLVNNTPTISKLSEEQCLQIALDSIHAESYLWQFPLEEASIKEIKNDPNATWYPKASSIYVPKDLDFNTKELVLTYKFNIHASVPRTAENVYISPVSGEIIARENQLHTTDVPGTAVTKYSGQKAILTDSTAPFNYRLRENTRGNGIYTFNMRKGTNYGAAVDFVDSNNYWNNVNANEDEIATDAHWGAETTYDYYKQKFNRNSYNNNNARIYSYVHFANNYDNAFWDGVRMTYGDGNNFKPLTSLDVCGHEITHAVTSNSANLIYRNESGQLNESFSDIFGNTIERFGKPNGYDWKIGEEITNNGSGLRNMSDPRLKGHPRCYKGTNWYYGTGDNGGVHLNSGVQNWWYYLITEGGSGTNDFSNVYKVDSIGINKAEQIAYRNLTVYLGPSSNYSDSRFYSIQAAIDLYGQCSKEVIAVTNAWYACNVGPEYDSAYVKADFSADTVVCSISNTVKFNNLSSNVSSSTWYFGDGNSSQVYSPLYTYSNYGNFTIKLVVESCFKNNKDSMTKTAYVKIDSTFDICNAVFMPLTGIDSTNKCESFVYDDGKEDEYAQLRTTYFRISTPGADSIRINFKDFDYETGYDSLYIYQGYYPNGIKIGGYTGTNLPNGGNSILVPGSVVTLKHFSDPFVVGRGFKLFYKAIKKPVQVTAYSDTSICLGSSVVLTASGTGGYYTDYRYEWQNLTVNDSVIVSPIAKTTYKVFLQDVCTKSKDSAIVTVDVREPLKLLLPKDTLMCFGQETEITASATGGNASAYTFTWDNGIGTGAVKKLNPSSTTTYRVILSDACTPINDTAYILVRVKDPLKVKITSNDTVRCFNKAGILFANGSGGDTMNYQFNWSDGLGNGTQANFNFTSSRFVKMTLMDMCSATPATDSIWIEVKDPLSIQMNTDSTICYGSAYKLTSLVSGGDASSYSYIWSHSIPDTSNYTVKPIITTTYKLTINDQCSDPVSDSVTLSVLDPIMVSGLKDSTICNGMQVPLIPIVSGGKSDSYTFSWNLGLNSDSVQIVSPSGSNTYRVIVNDGCSAFGDTASARITVKTPLDLIISSSDTSICYDKISSINVQGNGGEPSNYQFTWSNGLGTGLSKSIQLKNSAWITITLTDGCTVQPDIDSLFIKVSPELIVQLPADTLICYGTDLDIKPNVTGGVMNNYTYTWNQGLSAVDQHLVSPLVKTLYTLVVSDACSDDATDSLWVDVRAPLKIAGVRDTTICTGGIADINPLISGGITTQYQYIWSGALPANPTQSLSPSQTTSYKLRVTDMCSQPDDSVQFKVTVLAPLSLSLSLSDPSICEGDSSLLNIVMNGGKPTQYQWTVNGVNSTSTSDWKIESNTSNYSIQLSDNCSAPVRDSIELVVNQLPVVDFSSDKQDLCVNEMVQFTNLTLGASDYLWLLSPSDSSTQTNPLFKYTSSGTYEIQLNAISDSGCRASATKLAYINVIDLPKSIFKYSPEAPDFLNSDVQFTNLSTNAVGFEWDFGDLVKDNVNSDPNHNYQDTGYYAVQLITSNSLGCMDTAIQFLRVKDIFRAFLPNAITVNHDNLNERLLLMGRGIQSYQMDIYNRWGELVYSGGKDDVPFEGMDSKGNVIMKGVYVVNLSIRDIYGFEHFIRQTLEVL